MFEMIQNLLAEDYNEDTEWIIQLLVFVVFIVISVLGQAAKKSKNKKSKPSPALKQSKQPPRPVSPAQSKNSPQTPSGSVPNKKDRLEALADRIERRIQERRMPEVSLYESIQNKKSAAKTDPIAVPEKTKTAKPKLTPKIQPRTKAAPQPFLFDLEEEDELARAIILTTIFSKPRAIAEYNCENF